MPASRGIGVLSGEQHGRARLTESLVRQMRRAVLSGATIAAAAEAAGLSRRTAGDAITGATWAHVDNPPPVTVTRARRWTVAERTYLAEHGDELAPDVAQALGRTAHAVRQKRSKEHL